MISSAADQLPPPLLLYQLSQPSPDPLVSNLTNSDECLVGNKNACKLTTCTTWILTGFPQGLEILKILEINDIAVSFSFFLLLFSHIHDVQVHSHTLQHMYTCQYCPLYCSHECGEFLLTLFYGYLCCSYSIPR